MVASFSSLHAQESVQGAFPGFRHVDPTAQATVSPGTTLAVVMLADTDYAPWSYVGDDGNLKGISVDLAQQACKAAGLVCEIKPLPFAELLPALRAGPGQVIVTGLKLDATMAKEFDISRPYFQSLGRFTVRAGSSFSAPDVRTLAGRRIGYVANSAHGRFLEKYYSRSALTPFDTAQAMLEALRTGQIDAAFGDAVQVAFWLGGSSSRGCCTVLGKAFLHRDTFTRSLSFVARRDSAELRVRLDAALDQMEINGTTAEVFARYLPSTIW